MNSDDLANKGPKGADTNTTTPENQAVELLRHKISSIYQAEPNAKEELAEAEIAGKQRSKHQQFMHDLSTSGKSLAEIQTAWHNYYVNLPDSEKHEVWQEFYSEHSRIKNHTHAKHTNSSNNQKNETEHQSPHTSRTLHNKPSDERSTSEIKGQLLEKTKTKKPTKKAHFHSLLFGLSMGLIAVAFVLFGFFNERFIAPFISPSKDVSNTPLVINPASAAIGKEPKIIIPKINVEIPVVYDQPSIAEADIQKSLEEGVVHYATTPSPGEKGNGVIFGHSSNNILNKGKYKFAFVLLKQLEVGDTFYLEKDGKRYVYKVGEKKVVKPTDVSILYTKTEQSTMTLITCDPPGTSINRLLIIGQQISPDPSRNTASTAKQDGATPSVIPSNAPSLWQRLTSWMSS